MAAPNQDPKPKETLRQGAERWNAWREENRKVERINRAGTTLAANRGAA